MNQEMSGNNYLPTILMLRESNQRIELDSLTLAAFNIVYFPKSENITILSWIQEHQPDVIILEIDSADQADVNLLAPLKLDWLTRNIPILIAGNRFAIKAAKNLDYDLCLNSPYSAEDLERAVCSLINAPMCQTFVS